MNLLQDEKMEKANINVSRQSYGGFWIRLLAALLDVLIIGLPAYFIAVGLVKLTGVGALYWIIQFAVIALIVYQDGIKGGTPGKSILGLKIVNETGNNIGIPRSILRYIGGLISGLIFGLGYLLIIFTGKKQGLHDKISKTFVIYTK